MKKTDETKVFSVLSNFNIEFLSHNQLRVAILILSFQCLNLCFHGQRDSMLTYTNNMRRDSQVAFLVVRGWG